MLYSIHQIVTAATRRNTDDGTSLPAAVPQFPLLSDDVRRLMLTSQTKEGIEESARVIRDAEHSPALESPRAKPILTKAEKCTGFSPMFRQLG